MGEYFSKQSREKFLVQIRYFFLTQKTTRLLFHGNIYRNINCVDSPFEYKRKKIFFYFMPGPKGVINDWRKFKLESEDSDSFPPSKKDILRKMSSPQSRDDKDSKERLSRKVR